MSRKINGEDEIGSSLLVYYDDEAMAVTLAITSEDDEMRELSGTIGLGSSAALVS